VADDFDADRLLRWCVLAAAELRRQASEIDALNVFPVADADTGTNMSLTMEPVARAVEQAVAGGADLSGAAAAMSRAALMDARGNSGLILSQVLAGFAETLAGRPTPGPALLARCLERGSELAYAAVAEPVDGTILSVARAAASAARAAASPDGQTGPPDISRVAFAAAQNAATELARTPLHLRVLAEAGVVDAGGRGLVAVLAALVCAITGHMPHLPAAAVVALDGEAPVAIREAGSDSYRHEVCYLLHAAEDDLPALRQRLASLGDSVVIAGAGELWRVHAHVNDVDAALEAARQAGTPHRVTSTWLLETGPGRQAPARGDGGD
jgi:dihydroxyacetone kinase-like predicted kinase